VSTRPRTALAEALHEAAATAAAAEAMEADEEDMAEDKEEVSSPSRVRQLPLADS
jgi:hypothetical protein